MKNTIIICTLAAALAACGLAATKTYAENAEAPSPTGKVFQRIAEKLSLTDDQKAQFKTILAEEKDILKPLLTALHDARKNLRTAMHAGDASESSVRAASAKVATAEADLAVERMKLYGKIAPVLTDEQRQKITELEQRVDDFADKVIARIGSGLDN